MDTKFTQFINEYCDEDTYRAHTTFYHITWLDIKDGEIQGFISYFPLFEIGSDFAMIISHSKNNKYSFSHWKNLSKLIKNRQEYLVINSDKNNEAIRRAIKKYGGVFIGDDIHFPIASEYEGEL